MARQKMVICDTNILIEYFKNNHEVIHSMESFGINNAAISHITAAELYFGALNKAELGKIKKVVEKFIVLPLNDEISERFSEIMFDYSLSNKIGIPDALIASTAIIHDAELYTLNKKDFAFIKGLRLLRV
jgi:tRNA(fMet)-specific endonuclease VapC